MTRSTSLVWAVLWLSACADKTAPQSPALEPPPTPPAAAAARPAAPPNPCDNPAPIKLALDVGSSQETPWGIEFRYLVDEDKKLGSGYQFQLRSGERRWETRRDNTNWNQPLTWRGFCWRGAERPAKRALRVQIEIAPVCKDGKLQELGGCGDAFGPS
ncbi:MAG TPA: hypothetical protein VFN67_00365 [Polyangiales bacterium]|nr:hypothetical protein [Polyangiales bacterium]